MKGATRIGRKILVAILVVAIGPLVGALLLGRGALKDAYTVGVNEQVAQALEQGVDARRAHIVALRESAERATAAIGRDYRLRELVVAGDRGATDAYLEQLVEELDNVAAVTVRRGDAEVAHVESGGRLDTTRMRLLERTAALEGLPGEPEVDLVLAAPLAPFDEFQRAGHVAEVFSRLQAETNYVSEVYVWVYVAFLTGIIALALGLGVVLSRRVTGRVAALAKATRRVGAGDLTVTLPTGAADEVHELTIAFNDMVRDLRESRERIEYLQRIGAWQEFARRLAHEIKNPLTPIQLAVQEVQQTYTGSDEAFGRKLQDARDIVEEEVATLRRLVGEFSSFAKLPEATLEPADLVDFTQDLERSVPGILDDLGKDGAPAPVDVRVEIEADELAVRIDGMMLRRCMDNLVRNAVQAVLEVHPEGGGEVVIGTRKEGRRALLEVYDNGPGIPSQDRGRVFDPYYTTKSEGTGLGLAIVKKVVLEHEGEVSCHRSPAGGAAFTIKLPLVSPTPQRRITPR